MEIGFLLMILLVTEEPPENTRFQAKMGPGQQPQVNRHLPRAGGRFHKHCAEWS